MRFKLALGPSPTFADHGPQEPQVESNQHPCKIMV
ncbi:hypothetical protein CCACVL1_23200 [Corchorus capsularis]|uniref:Uncharacterized protein n=1 Tax=Corchorus capsularis TaxID=210143 RepID=A0A1R3GUR7_COCAP|nr:hypothetical protein CCACVL1_23200 [Corchorus capsularis]